MAIAEAAEAVEADRVAAEAAEAERIIREAEEAERRAREAEARRVREAEEAERRVREAEERRVREAEEADRRAREAEAAAAAEAARVAEEEENKRITERADFLALEERVKKAKEASLTRSQSIRYDSPSMMEGAVASGTVRSLSPNYAHHESSSRHSTPGPIEKIEHEDTAVKQIPMLRHVDETVEGEVIVRSIPVTAPEPIQRSATAIQSTSSSSGGPFFSYEELKQKFPPEGVDPSRKEEFLEDETFNQIFAMSKADFKAQPKWKRDQQKKRYNLF